jgi:hypothetical protein
VRSLRPVAIAWLFTAVWSSVPYVVATATPPAGTRFVGTFRYVDDFYNYLSYAEQARNGSLLFRNKVLLDDHRPALVNLEWSLVGLLARMLGGRLILAYRIFGLLAAWCMLSVFDLWMLRLGLPPPHRLPALLLLTTGGGFGGLLFTLGSRPMPQCLDLYAGLFPSICLLFNPHFVAGTALLLFALWCYENEGSLRAGCLAALAGTALALVRPYDFVLLALIRTAAVLVLEPVRGWFKALLPLAGLLPAVAYLYWLFYRNPAFSFYPGTAYVFPNRLDFVWALAPAALLSLTALTRIAVSREARRARVELAIWSAFGLLVIAAQPVNFSLQFLVGIGFPFLALAAVGVSRFRPFVTLATAAAFSTTLVIAWRLVLAPNPHWLVPRENMAIVSALEPECDVGDIVMAPPGIGLLVHGLTSCRSFVSHPIAPDYEAHLEDLRRFALGSPAQRLALLERNHIRHLILPGDAGPSPVAWLGEGTPFRRRAGVGQGPGSLSLYSTLPAPAGR